jgi:hypothetical protein
VTHSVGRRPHRTGWQPYRLCAGEARAWIEDLRLGCVATLAEIADRESLGGRHVRPLAPLAFVSPVIVAVIVDGAAPKSHRHGLGQGTAAFMGQSSRDALRQLDLQAHNLKVVGSNPTPATNF